MVYFQTKNPNFGKICKALQWKMFVHLVKGHSVNFPFLAECCTKKNLTTLAETTPQDHAAMQRATLNFTPGTQE
jgi:hypothetical protein